MSQWFLKSVLLLYQLGVVLELVMIQVDAHLKGFLTALREDGNELSW